MYKIKSESGAEIGMTEAPNYILRAANGCFNLCPEADAQGICFAGKVYDLAGRDPMGDTDGTVLLEQIDAGEALAMLQQDTRATAAKTGQLDVATKMYVQGLATTLSDNIALEMPDLFKTWDEVLAEGKTLETDDIICKDGQLYRVVQPTTPAAHQPPDGEGMLANYRPIEPGHDGTQEDPIPWVYGMDCTEGKYYSYNGKTYLCNLTMTACVWAPGTAGLWQWTEVTA